MKTRINKIWSILFLFLFLFQQYTFAQALSDYPSTKFVTALQYVPNSLTEVTSKTVYPDMMVFSNNTGSAVTVLVQDETTNCNSNPCVVIPTVSVAANTAYVVYFPGGIKMAGLKWQAGSSNAIVGYIRGAITP